MDIGQHSRFGIVFMLIATKANGQTSWRQVRMDRVEKALKTNKQKYRVLAHRQEKYAAARDRPVVDTQRPDIKVLSHSQSQPWPKVMTRETAVSGKVTDKNRGNSGVHSAYVNHDLVDDVALNSPTDPSLFWNETLSLHFGKQDDKG